ncbi:acyl-CoA thioesterase [Gammaproteobacteria bacterium LSUCC0112]|nr:acyl-CoA thioesterase [Gammaproteobacteria bacterium LSUCC0112]
MIDNVFKCRLAVRDYECDMQGVVNNSVYQNYLEHARHEFLKHKRLGFADLTRRGIIVVVVSAELNYLRSLRSGDAFDVTVEPFKVSTLRLGFKQRILCASSQALMLKALIVTTAVNEKGRPYYPQELDCLLE